MVNVLAYRAYGDDGVAVYGHILGTEYTYTISTALPDFDSDVNWIVQAGDGIIYRGRRLNDGDDVLVANHGNPGSSVLLPADSNGNILNTPEVFGEFGGFGLFVASSSTLPGTNSGDKILFTTDGDTAPEALLPFTIESIVSGIDFYHVVVDDFAYVKASDGDIWRTDTAGTAEKLVESSNYNGTGKLIHLDYRFQFQGDLVFDGQINVTHNMYRMDRVTGAITQMDASVTDGDEIFYGIGVGETKFFYFKYISNVGFELHVSDGTAAGTQFVKDINPGAQGSVPGSGRGVWATIGDKALFVADDGTNGNELWVSDGTGAGTFALTGAASAGGLQDLGFGSVEMINVGDKVFFFAFDPSYGNELHVTDGTVAGTQFLKNINSGASDISSWAVHDGLLYFGFRNGDRDNVWVSDGTPEGTQIASMHHTLPGANNTTVSLLNVVDLQAENIPIQQAIGTSADETMVGIDIREIINGGGGNDTISGGGADDREFGGAGNDIFRADQDAGNDFFDGGSGVDRLAFNSTVGGVFVNMLAGTAAGSETGNDTFTGIENVVGGQGNDFITPGYDANTINGNGGIDTLDFAGMLTQQNINLLTNTHLGTAAEGDTYISIENVVAGSNDDALAGDNFANRLAGGFGNDTLSGRLGDDVLEGGAGNDRLFGGAGNDLMIGGAGADLFNGGDNIDTVSYAGSTEVDVSLKDNTASSGDAIGDTFTLVENLTGGFGDDYLVGDTGMNRVRGGLGNDALFGWTGNDTLIGDGGNDRLFGGGGNDTLRGGTGNDELRGNGDADIFVFDDGFGIDTIFDFANGSDTINFADLSNITDFADLQASHLSFNGSGNAVVTDGSDVLTVVGLTNANIDASDFEFSIAVAGVDSIDTLDFSLTVAGVRINMLAGTAVGSETGNDTFSGIGDAIGGSGNDVFTPGFEVNMIAGNGGIDTLDFSSLSTQQNINLQNNTHLGTAAQGDTYTSIENVTAGSHNDALAGDENDNRLSGGAGNDTLSGRLGNDTLDGGDGNDALNGGYGDDFMIGGAGGDSFNGGTGGETIGDTISYAGSVVGVDVSLKDNLASSGDAVGDTFTLVENLSGSGGNDYFVGDTGANRIDGRQGNDTLFGWTGDDILNGDDGNDRIFGGAGADIIRGGAGNDELRGNGDADIFVFGDGFGTDTIFDFANGSDTINLGEMSGITSFTDLQSNHLSFNGSGNAVITDGADVLTIVGLTNANTGTSDFVFTALV